jgi:VRR-NUC domain
MEIKTMTKIVKLKKQVPPREDHEQIVFVTWLLKQGYKVSASANGGSRNLFEAMKLKRMGVSAGYPDVFLPLPTSKYHGFFIEMKRLKGGKVSEAQLEWLQYLRDKGYYAEVAHGAEEAKILFNDYLSTMLPAA